MSVPVKPSCANFDVSFFDYSKCSCGFCRDVRMFTDSCVSIQKHCNSDKLSTLVACRLTLEIGEQLEENLSNNKRCKTCKRYARICAEVHEIMENIKKTTGLKTIEEFQERIDEMASKEMGAKK